MTEKYSHDTSPQEPEAPSGLRIISRRSLIKGIGLFVAGGIAGGFTTGELLQTDQDRQEPGVLSEADYKRLEASGDAAKEQAKALQARINATIYTNKPVGIFVLDKITLIEKVGKPAWEIDNPILLGDPPKKDDVDKGFWFGMQYPDPGGVDRPPSVGIRAVLFDQKRMSLDYFLPEGKDTIAALQMEVLVMPPSPDMPLSSAMVAYGYNEFTPDHRQHRSEDPSSPLVAPGLQIPIS